MPSHGDMLSITHLVGCHCVTWKCCHAVCRSMCQRAQCSVGLFMAVLEFHGPLKEHFQVVQQPKWNSYSTPEMVKGGINS